MVVEEGRRKVGGPGALDGVDFGAVFVGSVRGFLECRGFGFGFGREGGELMGKSEGRMGWGGVGWVGYSTFREWRKGKGGGGCREFSPRGGELGG